MATDLERLVVQLSADLKGYENAMRRAQGVTTRNARAIESTFARSNRNIAAGFTALGVKLGVKLAGAFAVGASLRSAQKLVDTATRISNALKVAGLSGDDLTKVYDRLFASAQRNAAPLESLVTLYGRAAIVQKELGVSTEELLSFTDNVAVALRVAGTDAQSASGALLQLSQALGSGVVRAEEFNSVLEGALPIAQAAAAGLKEAGGSVAALRKLVIEGKVSSEAFFRAFEAGSVILQDKVANSTFTVAQGFERVNNALIDAAGRLDDGSKASASLAAALDALATAINSFDVSTISNELGAMSRDLSRTIDDLNRWVDAYGRVKAALGQGDFAAALRAAGGFLAPSAGPSNVQVAGGKGPRTPVQATSTSGLGSVSILDAPAVSGKDKKARKERENDLAREIRQIKERTAALQAETAVMAGLNPLVNDYGFALEKARAQQELLAAAEKEKIAITPELRAQIDSLATAYANTVVQAERLAESQDLARERAQEFIEIGRSAMGGLIEDLRNGVSAADAFKNALDKVLDNLIQIGLNSVFGGGSTAGLGLIGSLFGFAKGGYTGNGAKNQPKGVVHGGEFVFSKAATQRAGVGNLEAMHRSLKGYADGGFVAPTMPRMSGPASQPQQITITLVGEEGEMFTPRVQQISGQTAGVVVRESRPQLSRDAVNSVQAASRNRPGLFR